MKFDMNDLIKISNMISTWGRITSMEYEQSMTDSMIVKMCDDDYLYTITITMYPHAYHASIKQDEFLIIGEGFIDDLQELSQMLYKSICRDDIDEYDDVEEYEET